MNGIDYVKRDLTKHIEQLDLATRTAYYSKNRDMDKFNMYVSAYHVYCLLMDTLDNIDSFVRKENIK